MSGLLDDLVQAEKDSGHRFSCLLCDALAKMDIEGRQTVQGIVERRTIGAEKLSVILNKHGYEVGRRAIRRHQQEGHTP